MEEMECPCGLRGSYGRIVGGEDADLREYPWQVGVEVDGRFPWCGGNLISKTEILTAAHCTHGKSPSSIKVIVGENDISDTEQMKLKVAEVLIHPMYSKPGYDNDFSILRLASPLNFSSTVSPVCLPSDVNVTFTGEVATVTGWGSLGEGKQMSSILQEVNVSVVSNAACNAAPKPYKESITDTMLCARAPGKDACQGDSGGPLTVTENQRQTLVGVVSWGVGCALPDFPGVYARVTAGMDWILANSQDTYFSTCNVRDTKFSITTESEKNHSSEMGSPLLPAALLLISFIFQRTRHL